MANSRFIFFNLGDFLNRLKASEGEDTVVNSIGDVLEQQVRKKQLVEEDSSCTRLKNSI